MSDTKHHPRTVGIHSPRANDLKEVGKRIFPRSPTAKRLEALSRLMGFGSTAAYHAAIQSLEDGQRFNLPAGKPIVDDVLKGVIGHSDTDHITAIVDDVTRCLEEIGYMELGRLLPTLMPSHVLHSGASRTSSKSPFGDEMPGLYAFNEMLCTDIQYALDQDSLSFSEEMFTGDPGAGLCDRFWLHRNNEGQDQSWAHPVLETVLRRAIRNPDYVEWIVEDSIRSAGARDGVRCKREASGFIPAGMMTPEDVERSLRNEISIVRPYLDSMENWLHETSPKWRGPEAARSVLKGLGHGSMSLAAARNVVEDLRDRHGICPEMMAELVGLSQCTLPLGPHGGLPLPDFCLAAGLGLLGNAASVDRPTPDELESAVRVASEGENSCDAYDKIVLDPDVIDVLAREISVSRERGVQSLHVRIEMSVG